MTRLHVFDMDGTLLRGAAAEEISRSLGCFDEVSELEQAHLRGEVTDGAAWWERILTLWSAATERDLDEAFDRSPWMERTADVFADIARRGEHSVVISQSPLFIVRRLQRFGAEATFATTVERGVPVRIEQLLTARDKVDHTLRLLQQFDLDASDCVAYGDSLSDVELFQFLDRSVGVNPTAEIRAIASRVYDGPDLWTAYEYGRALLGGA